MSSRPIISYDDITLPYDAPSESSPALPVTFAGPATLPGHAGAAAGPPPKKRKKNNKNKQRNATSSQNASNGARAQSNSFVGPTGTTADASMSESYDASGEPYEEEEGWDEGGQEEESRELTHQEIWDDSALVDAWDAAMEEYEMFHGPGKDWKNEPVKKSPLWYNIPPDPKTIKSNKPQEVATSETVEDETDSRPLNFETFVPTHDPSLEVPATSPQQFGAGMMSENYMATPASGSMVSQDEAFQRALNAMYWGGYWTAMYHAQRHYTASGDQRKKTEGNNDIGYGEGEEAEVDDEDEDEDDGMDDEFMDSQR